MTSPGTGKPVTIAVDTNGADLGPAEVGHGAAIAARQGVRSILFGPADAFGAVDAPAGMVEVVDAPVSIAKVRPEHLVQFAFMGAALATTVLGVQRPKVALLSNGEESIKGTPLVQEAHVLLAERALDSPLVDFIGNTEGTTVLDGEADVVVADGFTGNVALKLI